MNDQARPATGELGVLGRWVRSPWPRLVVLAVVLGAFGWLAATQGTHGIAVVQHWVAALGMLGPVVFVLCYAAAAMAFFPVSVLSGIAGVLFGPLVAIPVVWLGCMLGAVGAFELGRGMSRSAVEQLAGARLSRVNRYLDRRGVTSLALLRLLPVGPFAMLNYLVAVTTLRRPAFLLGTGIGIVPGVIVYSALGGTVSNPASPAFLLSLVAMAALIVGGGIGLRRLRDR